MRFFWLPLLAQLCIPDLAIARSSRVAYEAQSLDTSATHQLETSEVGGIEGQEVPVVTARVFVHGTILAGYFFVDIAASWRDEYKENSLIERAMNSARKHPFLHQAELVLGLGLTDITSEIMVPETHPLYDERAAIPIIRAFDRTERCVNERRINNPDDAYRYYTFGWSGALSERKRNKESGYLYQALMHIRQELRQHYPDHQIRLELFAHSHGGQLVAHLPTIHKQFPENNLFIDLAVLCATPLYKEKMQPMVSSSLFGTILNLYSCGDAVQNLDMISTPEHFCMRQLRELNIPLPSGNQGGPLVIDLLFTAFNNPKVFDHQSFFSCCTYRLASYYSKRRHIRKTLDLFAPLPTLILFPAYYPLIEAFGLKSGFHEMTLNLECDKNLLKLETSLEDTQKPLKRKNARYRIKPLSTAFMKEYKHRARTSGMNQLKHAFYHIIHN